MSSREIEAEYQPLDADREHGEGSGGVRTRSRQRPAKTGTKGYGQTSSGRHYWREAETGHRWSQGGAMKGRQMVEDRGSREPESDEELWSRKLGEAEMPASEYAYMRNSPHQPGKYRTTGGRSTWSSGRFTQRSSGAGDTWVPNTWEEAPSMAEHIERHGVEAPISLGSEMGGMGKPQIVGGHHRMAVMRHLNPNQLMPVLHFGSIEEAQSKSAGYKYT